MCVYCVILCVWCVLCITMPAESAWAENDKFAFLFCNHNNNQHNQHIHNQHKQSTQSHEQQKGETKHPEEEEKTRERERGGKSNHAALDFHDRVLVNLNLHVSDTQ